VLIFLGHIMVIKYLNNFLEFLCSFAPNVEVCVSYIRVVIK